MTRRNTGTGWGYQYPHNNLNRAQRAALDRLHAPPWEFVRYWAIVTLTEPNGKGEYFWYGERRTWALYVKGWCVIQISGPVVNETSGPR